MMNVSLLVIFLASVQSSSNFKGVEGAFAPNLVETDDGAWMTWIEPIDTDKKIIALKCAKFDGKWSEPKSIMQGTNFFANWADFPEMGVAQDGTLFVTWPQQSGPGTYAYDIAVARSDDDGLTWTLMGILNDDRVLGEHGFVSLVPHGMLGVRAFWLDCRAMTGDGHSGEGGGDMQLRTAIIDDKVHESELLDNRVCECCGTDADIFGEDAIVVYRDRSEEEIRDIAITGLISNKNIIHEDHWKIEGCPVNGPSMDVIDATIAIAWFTASENKAKVYVAFSSTPILISNSSMGRVDLVLLDKNRAAVCWIEPNDESASVMLAEVNRDGSITNTQVVSEVLSSRASGFPRIAKVDGGVLVAWTDKDRKQGVNARFFEIN